MRYKKSDVIWSGTLFIIAYYKYFVVSRESCFSNRPLNVLIIDHQRSPQYFSGVRGEKTGWERPWADFLLKFLDFSKVCLEMQRHNRLQLSHQIQMTWLFQNTFSEKGTPFKGVATRSTELLSDLTNYGSLRRPESPKKSDENCTNW